MFWKNVLEKDNCFEEARIETNSHSEVLNIGQSSYLIDNEENDEWMFHSYGFDQCFNTDELDIKQLEQDVRDSLSIKTNKADM